jgi:hypothetical protein
VGDALRDNATLTRLTLQFVGLWSRSDAEATATLLRCLTGHASIRFLDLSGVDHDDDGWRMHGDDDGQDAAVARMHQALGELVAADAPSLRELRVSAARLGEAGLRPLCAALPRNSHLQLLECWQSEVQADFVDDVLLPALRANSGLRELCMDAGYLVSGTPDCGVYQMRPCEEAMTLVAARDAAE